MLPLAVKALVLSAFLCEEDKGFQRNNKGQTCCCGVNIATEADLFRPQRFPMKDSDPS